MTKQWHVNANSLCSGVQMENWYGVFKFSFNQKLEFMTSVITLKLVSLPDFELLLLNCNFQILEKIRERMDFENAIPESETFVWNLDNLRQVTVWFNTMQ